MTITWSRTVYYYKEYKGESGIMHGGSHKFNLGPQGKDTRVVLTDGVNGIEVKSGVKVKMNLIEENTSLQAEVAGMGRLEARWSPS